MKVSELVPAVVKAEFPEISPGDTVKVHLRIIEGEKERIQVFQGVVLRMRKGLDGGNFTVRRLSYGVGVERIFPFASPLIAKIELTRRGHVRRAKLYYLRGLTGKAARIKEDRETTPKSA